MNDQALKENFDEKYPIWKIFTDAYPRTLKNMHNPPKSLYVRGSFPAPANHKYLCVVGSRRGTSYGRDAVTKIIHGLKGYPVSIVSGLAIGIDSIAHMAALEADLHCVAFPGSTLAMDKLYPASHAKLAGMILKHGGALLSYWPVGYQMGKWAFPARNVFMAGLSNATLIAEAGKRSGSLMTAKHAEEFSRDVLAIPGSVNAAQSYGPHMLIRNGAALISSSDDLLEILGFKVERSNISQGCIDKLNDPLTAAIVSILSLEEATPDFILGRTGTTIQLLNEKLSILELEGLIRIEESIVKLA